jgi:hypothetical protein
VKFLKYKSSFVRVLLANLLISTLMHGGRLIRLSGFGTTTCIAGLVGVRNRSNLVVTANKLSEIAVNIKGLEDLQVCGSDTLQKRVERKAIIESLKGEQAKLTRKIKSYQFKVVACFCGTLWGATWFLDTLIHP